MAIYKIIVKFLLFNNITSKINHFKLCVEIAWLFWCEIKLQPCFGQHLLMN